MTIPTNDQRAHSPSRASSSMGPWGRASSTDSVPFERGDELRTLIQNLIATIRSPFPQDLWGRILLQLQQSPEIPFFQVAQASVQRNPPNNTDAIRRLATEILNLAPEALRRVCASPRVLQFSPIGDSDAVTTPGLDGHSTPGLSAFPQPSPPQDFFFGPHL